MALKPLEEGPSAPNRISTRCGGPEKARLPRMLKDITFNHDYKEADAPPEPLCRHYGPPFSRSARYVFLALFLGLISQFRNGHFPWFCNFNFPWKADPLSKIGNTNVEPSTSTAPQPASPCRSLIYVLC